MKILQNIIKGSGLLGVALRAIRNKRAIEEAKASGNYDEERKHILQATSYFGTAALDKLDCKLNIYGEENIPERGPVVVMSNHQGYADIPVIFALFNKFQVSFIAKRYLSKLPIFGKWMPRVRCVFIENDNPRESLKAINKGVEYVKDGFSMAICPEGTRSRGPEMAPFMKGAMKLATKPKVPIIPVSIDGTYRIFEESGTLSAATVNVIIHEPIATDNLSKEEEKNLSDRVENIIREGVIKLQNQNP